MASYFVRESFFRPPVHASQRSSLPAPMHNALQLLLKRHEAESLFIPVRSMQYLAVVDREEVIFVDGQGGYAYQDGQGGRLIRIAWRPTAEAERDSLNGPVPCEIVYYFSDLKDIQRRLMSELPPLLQQALQRQREAASAQAGERRVIPFRRGA
jgi:hypothetical protein